MKLHNVKTFLKNILGNLDKMYKQILENMKIYDFFKNNFKKDLKFPKRCDIIMG